MGLLKSRSPYNTFRFFGGPMLAYKNLKLFENLTLFSAKAVIEARKRIFQTKKTKRLLKLSCLYGERFLC